MADPAFNTKHRLCFIHIPKTAGKSIEKHFGQKPRPGSSNHATVGMRMERHNITVEEFRNWNVFCSVRHPLDRLVSGFEYVRTTYQKAKDVKPNTVFRNWVLTETFKNSRDHRWARPQLFWIRHEDYEIPKEYQFRIEDPDFNMNVTNYLRSVTGEDYQETPHLNKSQRKNRSWQAYYDNETYDLVCQHYREDLDYLGYEY